MKQPVLVVMAAGMGSRYGGLKQIDPIGKNGEFIIDYSLFDAKRAGFNKVIFVINRKIESIFKEAIGKRIENYLEVEYAFQDLTDIPNGYTVPENREKPWGTAHAIYAARKWIEGPFAVINADDFYGKNAFEMAYNFLAPDGTTIRGSAFKKYNQSGSKIVLISKKYHNRIQKEITKYILS